MILLILACTVAENNPKATEEDETTDSQTFTTEEPQPEEVVCGTASGVLPENLVSISYDDEQGFTSMAEQSFALGDTTFNESVVHESVRFELERPARVHGFSIQYAHLPEDGEVLAGIFDDFGYNGFDFWQWSSLWQGSRCVSEIQVGEWVDFVLAEPLDINQPGLIHVAHRREAGANAPFWFFDASTTQADGSCNEWDDCHSAWNLPEVQQVVINGAGYYAYNGFSGPFAYDYLVRLHIEWLDEPPQPLFIPLDDVELAGRQAWGDMNNDGLEDVFAAGKLLINMGDGTFEDGTDSSAISSFNLTASGGIWGDYDNDGFLDLFVFAESGFADERLLHNEGDGTFSDAMAESLIDDEQYENDCAGEGYITRPTAGAAWWDFNGDGFLDLYLANFICWTDFSFYRDVVYMNNGDGSFTQLGEDEGFLMDARSGRGANPADADMDGDIDLLVNNYTLQRNLFYLNNGDGTVSERSVLNGLSGDRVQGYYGHTIGTAWGDLDNDGDLDMIHANLAHPRFFDFSDKTQVLMNDGTGKMTDIQGDWSTPYGDAGLRFQETHSVPVLADFDQDGNLDLIISAVYPGRPTDFYWGLGDGTFTLDPYGAGVNFRNGWGTSTADIDNDGDMDVAVSTSLFRNESAATGHWLQIRVVGNQGSNQAGIGAVVRITAGDQQWIRQINGGTGQGEQNSIIAHFGLGEVEEIDKIEVRFPMREWLQIDQSFAADQRLWVYEDGNVVSGWHP